MNAPYHDIAAARAALEAANVVHLVPAARMAGFRFRIGLTKAGIIEGLARYPAMMAAAVMALQRLQAGDSPPAPPRALAADWLDDDNAPAPPPAPILTPPTPQPEPRGDVDLSEYAKRTWTREEILVAEGRSTRRMDAVQAMVAIAQQDIKALQESRPIVIALPERPEPIPVHGVAHPQFPDLLLTLRAGLHCMLVGPAGSGKTYSAEQAAIILAKKFFAQGAVTYAHELLGYIDAHSRYVRTQFRDAFEHGGIILLDEFDASSPEAALVVNAGLANGFCAFPDGLVQKHPEFVCIVGANTDGSGATISYSGRARLDGAFLDRFIMFRWNVDPRIEAQLSAGNGEWLELVRAVRAFALKRDILDVVATPRAVKFGAALLQQGMPRAAVLERTLKRGALVEAWPEVERLPIVANFLRG
jgi:hypothetical protein